MDTKTRPLYMLSTRNPHQTSRHIQTESEKMEKFHANGKQKKAGVELLISAKIGLNIKKITRDKEGHYIMIKTSTQEEDITIVNIYAPNIEAPQYVIRQTLTDIKGEIDSNTIIVGNFNTPLTPKDRSSKQKIKETQVLNDTLDEMNLIDIFRTFHPNAEDIPSSQVHMEHSPG